MNESINETISIAHSGSFLAAIGLGLVTIGAALGVGKIVAAALDGIARQPEASGKIQTTMFIGAALVEGVALFCAVLCFFALKS